MSSAEQRTEPSIVTRVAEYRERAEQSARLCIGRESSSVLNWNIVSELSGDPSEHQQRAEVGSQAEHCQWSSKQSRAASRTGHRPRAGQTAKRSIGSESSGVTAEWRADPGIVS
jgi:hypothetical protein